MEKFVPLNNVATDNIVHVALLSKQGNPTAKKILGILDRNNPKHLQIMSNNRVIDVDQLEAMLEEAA